MSKLDIVVPSTHNESILSVTKLSPPDITDLGSTVQLTSNSIQALNQTKYLHVQPQGGNLEFGKSSAKVRSFFNGPITFSGKQSTDVGAVINIINDDTDKTSIINFMQPTRNSYPARWSILSNPSTTFANSFLSFNYSLSTLDDKTIMHLDKNGGIGLGMKPFEKSQSSMQIKGFGIEGYSAGSDFLTYTLNNTNSGPQLQMNAVGGTGRKAKLSVTGQNPSLEFYNSDGNLITARFFSENNRGGFQLLSNGLIAVQAGSLSSGISFINADVKNFMMDHPSDNTKKIVYASIEGPEAAAYERGTAHLINGEAFISFSEHFEIVINSTTMTILTSPWDADSKGLAIIERNAKGFKVKELGGGKGNYKFDWEVKGVRKGYENYEVVRNKI